MSDVGKIKSLIDQFIPSFFSRNYLEKNNSLQQKKAGKEFKRVYFGF